MVTDAETLPTDRADGTGGRVVMLVFNDFRHDARVLKQARTLSRHGYTVRVVALHKTDLPEQETIDGFEVQRIALDPWHLRALRRLGRGRGRVATGAASTRSPSSIPGAARLARARSKLTARLNRVVGRMRRVAVAGSRRLLMPWHRSFSYLDFYRRAEELLRDDAFDVLHCHDLNTLPASRRLGRGRIVVYDSHELWVDRNRVPPRSWLGRRLTTWIEGRLLARVDHVFTVNDSIAEILSERYRIQTPTVVMNTPVAGATPPASTIDLRSICGIPPEQSLLLYTGGITFHRGLKNVIASLAELPECHFALMGPGRPDMIEELKEVATGFGVDDRVHFVEPVPSDQVAAAAASADVGIAAIENACLSYYLCSPNKLFEYLHAGLPVAASRFPELERVLETHDCGMTFEPSDPSSIARCVRDLLDDRARLREMAANAARAAGHFTWEKESAKLLDAYRRLSPAPAADPRATEHNP